MNEDDDKIIPMQLKGPIAVNLPEGLENLQLHLLDFGDPGQLWNMRKWLQKAMECAGAKQTGAGMGMGMADIDITLEGHKYNVTIKPILRTP